MPSKFAEARHIDRIGVVRCGEVRFDMRLFHLFGQ